ncbi:MAG: hypothetical protein JNM07_04535 [Phycisphaerae bacterium]|nr:hypothetical protein [Phycisphaerae bacterium]
MDGARTRVDVMSVLRARAGAHPVGPLGHLLLAVGAVLGVAVFFLVVTPLLLLAAAALILRAIWRGLDPVGRANRVLRRDGEGRRNVRVRTESGETRQPDEPAS